MKYHYSVVGLRSGVIENGVFPPRGTRVRHGGDGSGRAVVQAAATISGIATTAIRAAHMPDEPALANALHASG